MKMSKISFEKRAKFLPFRYIVEGSHALDRLLWFLLMILAFSCAGYFVWEAVEEWNDSPVITTIGNPALPVQRPPGPGS